MCLLLCYSRMIGYRAYRHGTVSYVTGDPGDHENGDIKFTRRDARLVTVFRFTADATACVSHTSLGVLFTLYCIMVFRLNNNAKDSRRRSRYVQTNRRTVRWENNGAAA